MAAEVVIAVFTVVLAIATAMLAWATIKLWKATEILAAKTQEDFARRKIQDTVEAWEQIRDRIPPGGLPTLDQNSHLSDDLRPVFRKLEYFAACVNSGAYDLSTFSRLSGSWFLQQYQSISGYVESRRNPRAYADLKELYRAVRHGSPGGGVLPIDDERDG